MCRAVMLFLLTQRSKLGKLFRSPKHGRKVHRKVSRALWKEVSAQKMRFCQNILTTFWALFLPHFLRRNFFQRALETFLWTLRTCLRYLKSLPNFDLASVKKAWRTTHQSDYMSGKVKQVEIFKKKLKMWLEYSDKTSFFEQKLLFKSL